MLQVQYDIKRLNLLKDILFRLRRDQTSKSIQADMEQFFKAVSLIEIWLMEHELMHGNDGVTMDDLLTLSEIHPHLYRNDQKEPIEYPLGHPIQICKQENVAFQSSLERIHQLLTLLEQGQKMQETDTIAQLQQEIVRLGAFHKHYHRKEKLYFPIMERYGHYAPTRAMWRGDDRIRALYKGVKRQIDQLPHIDLTHVLKTYDAFVKEFKAMIFQEEALFIPIVASTFHEEDWIAIATESDAFGYAMIEVEEALVAEKGENIQVKQIENTVEKKINMPFGGGYLTPEEANLILNHLPLEITFVDKNSVFKYFNEITAASEMMLVRTPTSVGRYVANCHPPKSLRKVMTLVRDLKAKRRTSESMWFKKKDQYIHITYKGIFNEEGEFLGILEYVQDIQPFFELPNEVKTGLSHLNE